MSTLTINQYAAKFKVFTEDLDKNNRPFKRAVQSTVVKQATRIFIEGRKSDGTIIGQYDVTKPLYINPDKSVGAIAGAKGPGFKIQGLRPTEGKNGDHVFKDGKVHKTTFVKNYKDYRNRIGKRIDRVNLTLSGSLFFDWINSSSIKTVTPHKITPHHYEVQLKNDKNQKIMEGMNEKYGMISAPTKGEEDNLTRISLSELLLDLKNAGLA